jgi:hypothetical protein
MPDQIRRQQKETQTMMPKRDTIDAIREFNATASPDFLAEFSNDDLGRYLDRLVGARRQRPIRDAADRVELETESPRDRAVARL